MKKESLNIETRLVHGSKGGDVHTGAISFPIYQSATFKHPAVNESTGYDYSRVQNPTREELENTIAALEGGTAGFAFSTGMAAIATVFHLFSSGDHIIVSDDLYGGTYRLFEEICKKNGMEFSYIDTRNIENVYQSVKSNTRGIFIETPSNPMMKVTDIEAFSKFAKTNNIVFIVDNTFLTPYFQRPLALGADIVLHSGTKYLGGHNDTLAGFVVVKEEKMKEKIELLHKTIGAVLAPFDCWLILRGIKTLGIRMEKQQENAIKIANWLRGKEQVEKVYYVGLQDHEGYAVSQKQATGFGAMISFVVKKAALAEKILKNVKVISFAESLGGVESLITYPITQTHASIPEEIRKGLGIDEGLLRLSVGIEDVNDLINDLEQAIKGEE